MPPAVRQRSSTRRTPTASSGVDRRFSAELIRVMYERDAKCPSCRYSLNGLVGHRCPECGHNVEEFLRVVDTMPQRWARIRRRLFDQRVRAVMIVVILLSIASLAGFVLAQLV